LIELPELYAKNIVGVLDIDNVVEIQKWQIIQGNKQYLWQHKWSLFLVVCFHPLEMKWVINESL
jgi:hypothetical protein